MTTETVSTGDELIIKEQTEVRDMIMNYAKHIDNVTQSIYSDFADNLKSYCKQLHQLLAWLWLPDTVILLEDDGLAERELRKKFRDSLVNQANKHDDSGSKEIKDFLTGKTAVSELTIPKFYETVNPGVEYLITSENLDSLALKIDVVQVTGVGEDLNGKLLFDNQNKLFIAELRYLPQRHPNEVTDANIKKWVQDRSNEYLPPEETGLCRDHYVCCF